MDTPSPPTPAIRRHRTLKQKWALISLPNKLMVIATLVIAAATIVNVLVARAMWREMQKTTVQVARQIDDFEAAQRAVLVMKIYAITDPIEAGKPLQLQCTIMNVGATAAMDVAISEGSGNGDAAPWIQRGPRGMSSFNIKILVDGIPNPSINGEFLGPNTPRDCSRTVGPIDAETLQGKWWADFTISASYMDVFGKSYIMNDCLILPPKSQLFRHCQMTTDPKEIQKSN